MTMQPDQAKTDGLLGQIAAFRRNRKGTAFIEFAFIAPIMIGMFFATLELSDAIMADRRVTKVASSVADLIARGGRTISCTDVDNILQIGSVLMDPYDDTNLSITTHVMQTTNAAGTTYAVKWTDHNGKGTAESAPTATMPAGLSRSQGEQVVVVQVRMPYQGSISRYFLKTSFELSESFYMKPREGTVDITGNRPAGYSCP